MQVLSVKLSNIHCDECEQAIREILGSFYKLNLLSVDEVDESNVINELDNNEVFYMLKDSTVKLYGNKNADLESGIKKITRKLEKSGFEIARWDLVLSKTGELDSESLSEEIRLRDPESGKLGLGHENNGVLGIFGTFQKLTHRRSAKQHLKFCKMCQIEKEKEKERRKEKQKRKKSTDSNNESSSIETKVDEHQPHQEFRASFAVSGMTCSSCVNTVEDSLKNLFDTKISYKTKNNDQVEENCFSVNLLQSSVVAIIPNKQLINQIIDSINDLGFECKLIEVLPVQRSINTKITALIGGMTCAACANSINAAVKELPFILECGINVVTKNAQFVLEDDNRHQNLKKLQETVEDCGFDFEILTNEKINYTSSKQKPRTINIKIDGMFCNRCPDLISDYLCHYGDAAVVINDPVTLKHPVIEFTYVPSRDITVRKFIHDLNHLKDDGNGSYTIDDEKPGTFTCEVVKPISVDEHAKKLAQRELMSLAIRLGLATLFAIPTFIFGIVAMSLLPKSHRFRMWVEDPIWVGNVSRNTWILFILATPVYFFAADSFHRKAILEVKSLWFHKNSFKQRIFKFGSMNLLMCLGTSVAYFASIALLALSAKQEPETHHGFHTTYFDAVVFLTFFLLIGKLLQSYSKAKTADAVSQLSSLKQTEATLVEQTAAAATAADDDDGDNWKFTNDQKVNLELLEIGDYIKIGSGESPPVDCVIVQGESKFDESALTGESTPVHHIEGHQIFSGTVNIGSNSVIAKVTSLESDSLLSQIVNTVRDGQLRKAPMERTADLITGYFVPTIVFLAIITWIIWLALGHSGALPQSYLDIDIGGWTVWSLDFAIAVFVIACPCGIGLAAPTALFVGSGLAAKYGILAKGGGVAFQDGANTNVVCFDKTGTLTSGQLSVTNYSFVVEGDSVMRQFALQLARDLEVASAHPLAKAIKSFVDHLCLNNGVQLLANKIPQVETIAGKGLKGKIVYEENEEDWARYKPIEAILGNEKLFEEYNVSITDTQKQLLTRWKTECKSVILVAIRCSSDVNFHLILMMAARDQIRPETGKVISYLHSHNIETWMITGDNKLTADAIASEIGITNVVSEVLPDEKEAQIKRVRQIKDSENQKRKCVIAMVGDGINDAPALASADVGIALSSGADLAVTSSDFILLNKAHPLISLVTLLDLSRCVFNRVKFNFGWSLVYNMIGIPIAAGVIYPYRNSRLDPVWASAAMALSSVSVVLSSLALRLYKPKLNIADFKVSVEVSLLLPVEE
ncbi:hypothetical protein KGF56_004260 [Candida oxycetoniae]|uniref:HMA domain-containing protein n=1 Tax=Candida oxycetoniae TaxID=497107 RepID=A0AAI9WWG6_9ASCO|nr:uncharacterized protein KGF56_004260 [Candida oxycetoniae]KAI3403007.2 hypothetical protein KGF56_004260 [Candida oxycetoniae]